MIQEGQKAPDFCLDGIDENGKEKEFCLKDLINTGMLILYFYPKDNTPGCTKEACDFRDNLMRLTTKARVIGISPDSVKSHLTFKQRQNINFPLLSDPAKKVLEAFGAFGEKKMYGKLVKGVIRSTFILDSEGIVIKKWSPVRVKGHVDSVLEFLTGQT